MDGTKFDGLTRTIAQRLSRRLTFKALVAGLTAGTVSQLDVEPADAARCRKLGQTCRKRRGKPRPKCCAGSVCRGNRCQCKPGRQKCGNKCITKKQCCRNSDCPNNQRCDKKTNRCGCGKNQRRCQGRCIAKSQCCTNADCPANQVCNAQGQCVVQGCESNETCASGACACSQSGRPEVPGSGTCQAETFSQSFSSNANGWYAFLGSEWSPPETDNVLTVAGGVGLLGTWTDNALERSAASPLGGYSTVFPDGGFRTSIEVYLDPTTSPPDEQHFSYSVAVNDRDKCAYYNPNAEHHFQGGYNGSQWCIGLSGSTGDDPCGGIAGEDHVVITEPGWYKLTHEFFADSAELSLLRTVTDPNNDNILEKTIDEIGPIEDVGGNRYAWFSYNSIDGLQIRNSTRTNGAG